MALGKLLRTEAGSSRKLNRLSLAFLGSLPARFQLAVARRAALAVGLRAALHGHRVVRHVFGDDGAGADIGAAADFHRRHQRGVGADEGAGADRRLVLGEAVIVQPTESCYSGILTVWLGSTEIMSGCTRSVSEMAAARCGSGTRTK